MFNLTRISVTGFIQKRASRFLSGFRFVICNAWFFLNKIFFGFF